MSVLIRKWIATAMLVTAANASAATLGSDNASNAPYNDGWQTNDNGGTGFGAWTLGVTNSASGSQAGFFIGDSKNLSGGSGADINSSGAKSFGLYGHTGGFQAFATRNFDGGALAVNQAFSIDIAVNFRNGYKGIDIREGSGNTILNLNIQNDSYAVNNVTTGGGALFANDYDANTKFRLVMFQTSAGGGLWSVTRGGGKSGTASGTFAGLAASLKLYVGDTGYDGGPSDFYANNLAVTPEPASALFVGLAGLAALGRRRRVANG